MKQQNYQAIEQAVGSGDKVLDFAMLVAAAMLWFKTVDVLSYFAPSALSEIFGFDMSYIYGAVSATLVEGVALVLHFNRKAHLVSTAKYVKWCLIAISGICQLFDGFITSGNVGQMSDTMKFGLQYGVPLVPLVSMVMIAMIGVLPDGDAPKKRWVGVANILAPAFDRFLHGDKTGLDEAQEKKETGNSVEETHGKAENYAPNSENVTRIHRSSQREFRESGD